VSESSGQGVFGELMRQMGSATGDWNPEPDDHILGMLRPDVTPSPNEIKAIFLVKSCCIRKKPGGRTVWGKIDGEPLTVKRLSDYFDWDVSNAAKHLKRPLGWGFIQIKKGVLGMRADVTGTAPEEDPDTPPDINGENKAKVLNSLVCTYHVPEYVAIDLKRLSFQEVEKFATRWIHNEQAQKRRLADAQIAIRERRFEEQQNLCQEFGSRLKKLKDRDAGGEESRRSSVQLTFSSMEDFHSPAESPKKDGYVRTKKPRTYAPERRSVQTGASLSDFSLSSETELRDARSSAEENQLAESRPARNKEAATPRPPDSTENLPVEVVERNRRAEITRTAERLIGRRLRTDDPLRDSFPQLALQFDLPVYSVCAFLEQECSEQRRVGQPVSTLAALYDAAVMKLHTWSERHRTEIEHWRRIEQRHRVEEVNEPFDPQSFVKAAAAEKGMP
jgi:hypothetical protein